MDFNRFGNAAVSAPAMTFGSFAIAWIIYSIFSLNFYSVIYAILTGVIGVAALEFLSRFTNPIVGWVLLSIPLIYIIVVAAVFGSTFTLANLNTRIMPGCQGAFCMKGSVQS